MASYPWIVPHDRHGQNLDDFPNLKRWFEAIEARPATTRAYADPGQSYSRDTNMSDEQRKLLFGQTAAVTK